jgi:hypothetical protein
MEQSQGDNETYCITHTSNAYFNIFFSKSTYFTFREIRNILFHLVKVIRI